ncbi:MAG: prepilin-type N-terminal cleavage/methylation domain-containing protein [Puniceicoccales bacterium]
MSFAPSRKPSGFSLVELLVVVAVLGVLAGIIYSAVQKVYLSGQKAIATNNLRQVGAAMQLYVQDHGTLPGPMWRGQSPWYNSDSRALGYNLAEYLDLPAPDGEKHEFPYLSCPLFEDVRPAESSHGYIICDKATLVDGSSVDPWGYRKGDSETYTSPQSGLSFLSSVDMDSWALRAFDAGNNTNPDAGWAGNLLDEPLFPGGRLHLYFDWRVEFVALD